MEMEVDEQQLIRAIAMSLGEEVVVPPQPSTSAPSTSAQSTSEQPASELSTSEQSTSEQSTSEQSTSEQSTSEQSIVQMATQMAVRATSVSRYFWEFFKDNFLVLVVFSVDDFFVCENKSSENKKL